LTECDNNMLFWQYINSTIIGSMCQELIILTLCQQCTVLCDSMLTVCLRSDVMTRQLDIICTFASSNGISFLQYMSAPYYLIVCVTAHSIIFAGYINGTLFWYSNRMVSTCTVYVNITLLESYYLTLCVENILFC
jgi:hypothetical protein